MNVSCSNRLAVITSLLLVAAASIVFISGDSLWMDEGNMAYKAVQGSLRSWYETLISSKGSDLQMPGYMLYMWGWEKIFGSTEIAFRAGNIPWLLLSVWALRRFRYATLALIASPFVIYYMNDARPYVMQIAAASVTIGALAAENSGRGNRWQFLVGCLLLCASSLIGVIWAGGAFLCYLLLQPAVLMDRKFWRDIAISSPAFLGLAAHYVYAISQGEVVNPLGSSIVVSLGAAGYELLGLMGLGPGKIQLRENPKAILGFLFPVAVGSIIFGITILAGSLSYLRSLSSRARWAGSIGVGIPCLLLVAMIFIQDFRLLGRHLAPLAVLIVLCIARALEGVESSRKWNIGIRLIAVLAIMMGLASGLSLRFAERHRKDDFRGAAKIARATMDRGQKVIWAACEFTGSYYQLPGVFKDTGLFEHWHQDDPLPHLNGDEQVIMSRPDIMDPSGKFRALLESKGFVVAFRLWTFTVYEVTPQSIPPTP